MAKPIFVATHPRACSTAFERVFMTQLDSLNCFHEPFGDAFYYGPERMSGRFEGNEAARITSGFSASTYKSVAEQLEKANKEDKRGFIKDMAFYLVPPEDKPASIAPSLAHKRKGVGTSILSHGGADEEVANGTHSGPPYPYGTESEPENPTVVPRDILKKFHFAFLIRHPSRSIPSLWRCCVPPQNEITGFESFMPNEAGYAELRSFFDYLRKSGQVGPAVACQDDGRRTNGDAGRDSAEICVIDADDLLDYPAEVVEKFCKSVGLDYKPDMLKWGDEVSQRQAVEAFEKWRGWHDDAINSTELRARQHKHMVKTIDEDFAGWSAKFGADVAGDIRKVVEANLDDYNYLKQFAIKVGGQ